MKWEYKVWSEDYGSGEDDAESISATDAYSAAQEWAEKRDRDDAYYIANGNEVKVSVRHSDGVSRFLVWAETEIRYTAKMIMDED